LSCIVLVHAIHSFSSLKKKEARKMKKRGQSFQGKMKKNLKISKKFQKKNREYE